MLQCARVVYISVSRPLSSSDSEVGGTQASRRESRYFEVDQCHGLFNFDRKAEESTVKYFVW